MYAAAGLFSGDRPPATMLASIGESRETRMLLIVAGSEEDEIEYNRRFAEAAGGRAGLWIAPGVSHTGAFKRYPAEYEERVAGFFRDSLIE